MDSGENIFLFLEENGPASKFDERPDYNFDYLPKYVNFF